MTKAGNWTLNIIEQIIAWTGNFVTNYTAPVHYVNQNSALNIILCTGTPGWLYQDTRPPIYTYSSPHRWPHACTLSRSDTARAARYIWTQACSQLSVTIKESACVSAIEIFLVRQISVFNQIRRNALRNVLLKTRLNCYHLIALEWIKYHWAWLQL